MIYAGIGSRKSPPYVLEQMRWLGGRLARAGFVLRSGAAEGADTAFEEGCMESGGAAEIWLPWKGFNGHGDAGLYGASGYSLPSDAHFDVARELHPSWHALSPAARKLHARNVGQILGADLNTPASFVACWTLDGCEQEATRTRETGGTATAIVLASRRDIPVFNFQARHGFDRLVEFLRYSHAQSQAEDKT